MGFFFFYGFPRVISFFHELPPENRCGNCSVARRSVGIARIASLILIELAVAFFAALNLSAGLLIPLIAALALTLGHENRNV